MNKVRENIKLTLVKKVAEREGFEPSVHVSTYGHLANDWFKPTHPPLRGN